MRKTATFALIASILLISLAFGQDAELVTGAGERRGMVPEDYYLFQFVSDPQISPDGTQIAFVVATVSDDRRSRESSIWMVPADGSAAPRKFTGGTSDRSPRWSPDGTKLAFSSNRDGRSQIYVMSVSGGEAAPIAELEKSASSFEWLPDGAGMILSIRTDSEGEAGEKKEEAEQAGDTGSGGDSAGDPGVTAGQEEEDEPEPDVKVITWARYKANGTGYLDERRSHIWHLDLASGDLTQLTSGADWNDSSASISPDGTKVAFSSNRTGEEYEGDSNSDVWVVPVPTGEVGGDVEGDVGGEVEDDVDQLTTNEFGDGSPLWSPDGRRILYTRTDGPYDQPDLFLMPASGGEAAGGETRSLTEEFDRIPRNVSWAPDGSGIFFTASDWGSNPIFRLDLESGETEKLLDAPVTINNLRVSKDGQTLAFTLEDELRLPEVWAMDATGGEAQQLTRFNDKLLGELLLQPAEEFRFTNDKGYEVQGFLVRPIGWRAGESYPLILNIHGGPSGMWGHSWFHEFQMLAAQGYAVAFINYRGSTGYGFDFQKQVRWDYGGADYEDNMQGLAALLEREPWIDRDRLGVTGGSHGGFLTNWTISQTDIFAAAVTQRSVSNWVSEAGTQQYTPRQMNIEFNGSLWDNYELYWERSPIKYANQIVTPTLIIHSDQDHICPIGQAQELFYALKNNGVPTELVIFEGENHGLSRGGKPVNLVERLRRMIDWFASYLQ
jgi:dipeptidyl aminopeptidase/acylaminoacyl peptidase